MDVSIIIPAHNVERYIKKCLDTVLNQKTKYSYEIICVNDASEDKTYDIIKRYKNKIKLINNIENLGPGATRNIGLQHCSGDYLMFVDGDDYVSEDFIEIMVNEIKKNDAEIVICNFYRVNKRNDKLEKVNKGRKKVYYKDNIEEVLLMEFHSCNKIVKRELIEENKYAENIYFEDVVAISKANIDAKKIVKIEDYLYYYRRTNDSITNNLTDRNYDIIKALELIENKFIENGYSKELEFLYINNILVDLAIKVLKAKKNIKDYLNIIQIVYNKYPEWYKNKHIKKTRFLKKLYLYCLKNKHYKIIKFYFNR